MVTQETWVWKNFGQISKSWKRTVFDRYQSLVFGSFFGFVFFFSFRLVFEESNFSEFMDSAYRTELVDFKESTTLQSSILVGFCLLPSEFLVISLSFKLFVPLFRNVWRLESPTRIFKKSSLQFGIDKNA